MKKVDECRKKFVHKKTLKRPKREQEATSSKDEESGTSSRRSSRERGEGSERVYPRVCIFCDQNSKYMKGTQTREPLTQTVDLRADETIRNIAIKKNDQKILAIESRELVAAEAHFHRSCYKNYTKRDP